ncbi:hypothetical protein [Paenibacillus sinopodophylli]|nr:hypothetical protein [Paenibacillus sinopodophylli]
MTQHEEVKGRSAEQAKQDAQNTSGTNTQPEAAEFDKKLDGPNRPSV